MKTLFAIVLVTLVPAFLEAALIRSPFALGNSSTPSPFFVTTNTASSVRYQQVYGGSDFQAQGNGNLQFLVTGISYTAGTGRGGTVTIPNLQIDFSTTQKTPDGLSILFGENVGPDDTVVFSGPVTVTETSFEWNMQINFQRPFFFDSQLGNLLMDVRNFQTIPPAPPIPPGTRWEALSVVTVGDTASHVQTFDVNSLNATSLGTEGLLTLFTVTPVPEPSPIWLFAVGTGVVGLAILGRKLNSVR